MKGTFTVIVSPDGSSIKVDVGDVIGAKCVDLSKIFTDLGNIENSEKKSEYFTEISDNILVSG